MANKYIIGSARINENGKTTGGKLGDNNGKEVSTQDFYEHSKGWYVLRAKDKKHRKLLAEAMKKACNNNNIGYDQNKRLYIIRDGIESKNPTACDCSSLVRACIIYATGKDVGNFTTYNEVQILKNSKLFEDKIAYNSKTKLEAGDILVTKVKGHTVIVISTGITISNKKTAETDIDKIANDVIDGKYGNGQTRVKALTDAGYDAIVIQKRVNEILKGVK